MSTDQKALEVKVGLFVLIGLLIIAAMAVQFGRLGQGLTKFYSITVEFPNAGGLMKNSDVLMAGAKVGHVAEQPQITAGMVGKVFVRLNIREDIKLPKNSKFLIGSAGLLGDKFVVTDAPDGFDPAKFDSANPDHVIAPGATIQGSQPGGIDAIAKEGAEAAAKLNRRLDELGETIATVRSQLLSDANLKNLSDSFTDIKTTTGHIAEASKKVDSLMAGAQNTVDTSRETMAGAKQVMASADAAVADIRSAVGDAREVIQSAQVILKSAKSGNGIVPMLLGDSETADNLNALIFNIRKHGLLFYRDSAIPEKPPLQTPAAPGKKPK